MGLSRMLYALEIQLSSGLPAMLYNPTGSKMVASKPSSSRHSINKIAIGSSMFFGTSFPKMLNDQIGSWKFTMAAEKLKVPIFHLVNKKETKFQLLSPPFIQTEGRHLYLY